MRVKRICKNCGSSEHMSRVVDAKLGVHDVRYRICYRCHPELDAGSHLNGPEGGLKAMKSEHRDSRWDYLEPVPRDLGASEDGPEEFGDEDTLVDLPEPELVH